MYIGRVELAEGHSDGSAKTPNTQRCEMFQSSRSACLSFIFYSSQDVSSLCLQVLVSTIMLLAAFGDLVMVSIGPFC